MDIVKPKFIVKRYSPDQQGQDIKDEDVVRPSNYRYCYAGSPESIAWKFKSTARCPTYGSCFVCMRSGPAGKRCNACLSEPPGIYTILLYRGNILDSITLAGICETGHETAKADRTFGWMRDPTKTLDMEEIAMLVQRSNRDGSSPLVQETMRRIRQMVEDC
jgi:hypothetical protein